MIYNTEQYYEIAQAKIRLNRTGHPSTVARINLWVEEERPFTEIQTLYKPVNVKPEKATPKVVYDPPPRSGKGSGEKAWRKFAKNVSDMDPEIIDSMSRPDIIQVLEDKGVITK